MYNELKEQPITGLVRQVPITESLERFLFNFFLFQSENYTEEYISFPIVVTLQQRLYFQVSVDTPDTRLGIIADTCYATPINSISKKEKHDLIING